MHSYVITSHGMSLQHVSTLKAHLQGMYLIHYSSKVSKMSHHM